MKTNITKFGSSLYILIPGFVVKGLSLTKSDTVEMVVEKDRVVFIIERRKESGGVS
jgi:antitoxin component of MazEF toxin-antitoxin module